MTTPYEKQLDVVVDRPGLAAGRETGFSPAGVAGAFLFVLGLVAAAAAVPSVVWATMLTVGFLVARTGFRGTKREPRITTKPETVRVTAEGVEVGNATVPFASIAQAYVQSNRSERPTVRLVDRFGIPLFEAAVENESAGDDFLRALGRDVQHPRETWKVVGPFLATGFTRVGTFAGAFAATLATSAALSALGFVTAINAIASTVLFFGIIAIATPSAHVDIGADGLLFRWLWTKRFVPWGRVEKVDYASGDAVRVVVKGERSLRLEDPLARLVRTASTRALVHASLRARIVEAWQAHRILAAETMLHDQLARGGRGVREWRQVLASLRSGDGGYRQTATRDEDLWRVVENAAAPGEARAAAALALRAAADAPVRLRIAAEAVASPRLRIALETAADREAEDAALDDALERVAGR